jgi:hypothetical protein
MSNAFKKAADWVTQKKNHLIVMGAIVGATFGTVQDAQAQVSPSATHNNRKYSTAVGLTTYHPAFDSYSLSFGVHSTSRRWNSRLWHPEPNFMFNVSHERFGGDLGYNVVLDMTPESKDINFGFYLGGFLSASEKWGALSDRKDVVNEDVSDFEAYGGAKAAVYVNFVTNKGLLNSRRKNSIAIEAGRAVTGAIYDGHTSDDDNRGINHFFIKASMTL